MAKFKIGDVCILIGSTYHKNLIGTELTITGNLHDFVAWDGKTYTGYLSDLVDPVTGRQINPREDHLKLKPPKEDTKFKGEENIMKLFTSLDNSGKIEFDKLIEEEIV